MMREATMRAHRDGNPAKIVWHLFAHLHLENDRKHVHDQDEQRNYLVRTNQNTPFGNASKCSLRHRKPSKAWEHHQKVSPAGLHIQRPIAIPLLVPTPRRGPYYCAKQI